MHSADGWENVLKPVVARYGKVSRIYFRADAGFANPDVYEYLEAERIKYAIRLSANRILQERIGHLLTRPVGRPPNEVRRFYANFALARTSPASWIAPPNKSIFSVSVVLPASGCEMIAKVRRRATGFNSGIGLGFWGEGGRYLMRRRASRKGRLFPAGLPALVPIPFRQSELRPHGGQRGQ